MFASSLEPRRQAPGHRPGPDPRDARPDGPDRRHLRHLRRPVADQQPELRPGVGRPRGRGADGLRPGAAHQRHQQPHLRRSAGHSLLRDMYGNDSVYRGSNPTANAAVETGGAARPASTSPASAPRRSTSPATSRTATTNADAVLQPAPVHDQHPRSRRPVLRARLHPLDPPVPALNTHGQRHTVAQTFEILEDDFTAANSLPRLHARRQPGQPDDRPELPSPVAADP